MIIDTIRYHQVLLTWKVRVTETKGLRREGNWVLLKVALEHTHEEL